MKRAAIYARFSAGPQQTEQSIQGQVRVCEAFIEDRGMALTKVYGDHHISGTTDKRPQFQEMMRDAKKGKFDALVVYSSDRFSRSKYDSVVYKAKLRELGIEIFYAAENIPEGPEGVLLESLMEGWAQYYSEELSRKVKRGMQESARKAHSLGPKPYGYKTNPDKTWAIDEDQAPIVRMIFDLYLKGHTQAEVVRAVNDLGYRTRAGHPWTCGSVRAILTNPKYTGVFQWGDIRIEDGCPRLVSDEDFDAAQIKLAHKQRRPRGDFRLSGKLCCGICGEPLRGTSGTGKSGRRYYYYKGKCPHIDTIPRDLVEAAVFEGARGVLTSPVELDTLASKINTLRKQNLPLRQDLDQYKKQRAKLDKEADRLVDYIIEHDRVDPRIDQRLEELSAQVNNLDAKIQEIEVLAPELPEEAIKKGLLAFLASSSEVLSTLVNRVTLYQDHLVIWFNLIEDDRVKTSDLIVFDQNVEWWAYKRKVEHPGKAGPIQATPWGLARIVATDFPLKTDRNS